jgi:phosphoglycolate phosphatase
MASFDKSNIESIIFDMDGTLWDATHSYVKIWDRCFEKMGYQLTVPHQELVKCMGMPIEQIYEVLVAKQCPEMAKTAYLSLLQQLEDEMMPEIGGILYPGVLSGLDRLAKSRKLFMVSNCGALGLHNFMRYTRTEKYFTDSVTFGQRPVPKSKNMRWLMNKHGINKAAYMGDTQGDCDETHHAGLPFIFASYGFGKCTDAEISFNSFGEFVDYFDYK